MTKLYIIRWKSEIFALSVVEAENEEEARKKAMENLDKDFGIEQESLKFIDWEIDKITEIDDVKYK